MLQKISYTVSFSFGKKALFSCEDINAIGYCMRLKNFDLQIVQKTVFNLGTGLPNNVDSLSIV